MPVDRGLVDELYSGLQFIMRSSFPKRCSSCGKVYATSEEFLAETETIQGKSGLKQSLDEDDKTLVELFRNCSCGSTLMEIYKDRRDTSPAGLKRRERFGQILDRLVAAGLHRETGRQEILKVMRGGQSEILEKYGLRLKKHA